MSAKAELQKLVDVLSEYECQHLLSAVQDVADGERFWEHDMGLVYNEHVKARYFNVSRNMSSVIPAGPVGEEGLFIPVTIVKSYGEAPRIELPPPEHLDQPLSETLRQRRSRRDYTGASISPVQLSTLLHHTCGVTEFVVGYDYTRLPLRTFPSSGGLQVPEVYLSVQAVSGIDAGLYHYHPVDHVLECLKLGDHGPVLADVALGQPYLETAAVVFLLTGYYERLRWKYGERAYRYMCMDVGFLGENLYLAATALGLGVCAIAGFIDDAFEKVLEIDGEEEIPLLLTTVGVPRPGPSQ
jgi:SagB-type dehydrogenase family enzyme